MTMCEKMDMVSCITKKLRVLADNLGLELYPTTRLSKGELWAIFYNPNSYKARKIEVVLEEFVDTQETYDGIRKWLINESMVNGLEHKYDIKPVGRFVTTYNPYLDTSGYYGELANYWKTDVDAINELRTHMYGVFGLKEREQKMKLPRIEKVIFNDPATIVIWRDGTKTVVKAENELFDPEKGLAMAISKKALGNEGNYYETFKKWLPEANK